MKTQAVKGIPPNPTNKGIRETLRTLGVGKYIRVPARTRGRYYSECKQIGKKCTTRSTPQRKGDTEPMIRVYVTEILSQPPTHTAATAEEP